MILDGLKRVDALYILLSVLIYIPAVSVRIPCFKGDTQGSCIHVCRFWGVACCCLHHLSLEDEQVSVAQ